MNSLQGVTIELVNFSMASRKQLVAGLFLSQLCYSDFIGRLLLVLQLCPNSTLFIILLSDILQMQPIRHIVIPFIQLSKLDIPWNTNDATLEYFHLQGHTLLVTYIYKA